MRPSVSRSLDDWKREFDLMKASGITGIIPEIYNGGRRCFAARDCPCARPGSNRQFRSRHQLVSKCT
jgi:hypothetical protein